MFYLIILVTILISLTSFLLGILMTELINNYFYRKIMRQLQLNDIKELHKKLYNEQVFKDKMDTLKID